MRKPFSFVGFRVDPEDRIHLDEVAEKNRINLSDLLRMVIFENIDHFGRSEYSY
jgi:hypothetical protein